VTPTINDRREIFGWAMYDWANSAFQTTVVTVLFGPYLTALAQQAAGENGTVLNLGPFGVVTAKSLFPYCVSLSVFLQVFLLPVLGAIADYTSLKKRLMAIFCYIGATATCLLFFVTGRWYLAGGALFVVANLGFGASIVLYNAFLNDITTSDRRDQVSSRGYALGYLGGGLLLALNLALMLNAARLGLSRGLAVRISLLSAGLWWGGFAAITFRRLQSRAMRPASPLHQTLWAAGLAQVAATFSELRRLPQTLRYLIAYMLYNDGIQTVIVVSAIFAAQELGMTATNRILVILMIQFVAFLGAYGFAYLARRIGARNAIILSLVVWSVVTIYAYAGMKSTASVLGIEQRELEFWLLAFVVALVLGGSQALSRSLFAQMIPRDQEAEFFSFYEISERGTSWLGTFIFGVVNQQFGSLRLGILSLIFFFVVGLALLPTVNVIKAIGQGKQASRPSVPLADAAAGD
jgi:UMF1 family MFS transporter